MRGERHAQTPDSARRGGGVQPLQRFAGACEAANPVEGGGHVRAVVDRLADVGEGDAGEPRSGQDRLYGRRVGERERIRSPTSNDRCSRGSGEGLADRDVLLVSFVGLPDHHH